MFDLQIDDRLVHEQELPLVERVMEIAVQFESLEGRGAHGRFVKRPLALAGRLGSVHGDVGVAHHRRRGAGDVGDRDTDACRQLDLLRIDDEVGT